jgi:SH3-like domain-containing protein
VPAKPRIKLFLLLLLALLPATAWGLDFRSVAASRAVLYDAPSAQAKKQFVVGQYYPVEVIVNLGEWIKVRDCRGELAWIEAGKLAPKRTVLVTVAQADVRKTADASAAPVFRAEKDVMLELLEPSSNGWAKVRHRDGLTGYIQSSQVWGL